jgi:hypothetical protein
MSSSTVADWNGTGRRRTVPVQEEESVAERRGASHSAADPCAR